MNSFLSCGLWVQIDSCSLVPKMKVLSLNHWGFLVMPASVRFTKYTVGQDNWLDYFSPLDVFIATSDTVRDSSWGRGFHFSSKMISPCHISEAYSVFSNSVRPSNLGLHIKAIAIVHIVWGIFWIHTINKFDGCFFFLGSAVFAFTCSYFELAYKLIFFL